MSSLNENKITTSFFRNSESCTTAREHEALRFSADMGDALTNAIVVKDTMKLFLQGEITVPEIEDVLVGGYSGTTNNDVQESEELQIRQMAKTIRRACRFETRVKDPSWKITIAPKFVVETEYYPEIHVTGVDAVFEKDDLIEAVIYKAGRPWLKEKKGTKNSIWQDIPAYLTLQALKQLVPEGKFRKLKVSYYYMYKSTDRTTGVGSNWEFQDFFDGQGGNIVSLEDAFLNTEAGRLTQSEVDDAFLPMLEEFAAGKEGCSGDDCKGCFLNPVCNYIKTPESMEKKEQKRGKKIEPSEAQKAVIQWTKGLAKVNAGAGAGKTETVAENVKFMINQAIENGEKLEDAVREVLLITFTDAGANEMKDRVIGKLMSEDKLVSRDDISAMTFNTFAYNIVRKFHDELGFPCEPAVIDDVRNMKIIANMLDETHVDGLDYLHIKANMPTCRGALACASKTFDIIKSKQVDLEEIGVTDTLRGYLNDCNYYRFMSDQSIEQLVDLYGEYKKQLIEDGLLTFADQEPMAIQMLEAHPEYLDSLGYKHVIVDEFQDSNDIQLDMIRRLTKTDCFESLLVVGDDSQAIFGFRDTTPENIIHFSEKMDDPVTDMFLVDNYRSVPEILDLANKVNALNEDRVEKDLVAARPSIGTTPSIRGFYNAKDEYEYIADKMAELIDKKGYEPEEIAFIAGTNAELERMQAVLSQKEIPWVMKNPMKVADNSRVNAAISLAQAFYTPHATQLYFEYLCAKYNGEIMDQMTEDEIIAEVKEMENVFSGMDLKEIAYQRILFHEYLDAIKANDEIYEAFLGWLYQNEDLQSELQYVQDFKKYGMDMKKKMEQSYKGVVLVTAHSSKGLEWRAVFNSISAYDGKQLHKGRKVKELVEEKRRLLFVSLTRARDELFVTGLYKAYGSEAEGYTYNQFLKELYDITGQEYVPVDPMEAVRKEEAKKRASERAKARREELKRKKAVKSAEDLVAGQAKAAGFTPVKGGGKSRELTEEEKAEYNRLVRGSKQASLF